MIFISPESYIHYFIAFCGRETFKYPRIFVLILNILFVEEEQERSSAVVESDFNFKEFVIRLVYHNIFLLALTSFCKFCLVLPLYEVPILIHKLGCGG